MARTTWAIDASHTRILFMARHMVVSKVRGSFKKFHGVIELDEEDLTKSNVAVTIDAASVDTADPTRDTNLRSADSFDVERFPSLLFTSKSITKRNARDYDVTGDLTIRGVTKAVVLDAEFQSRDKDPWGNESVSFSATASVNREHFGLKWSQVLEAGGVLVSTKIQIDLDVRAVRTKAS